MWQISNILPILIIILFTVVRSTHQTVYSCNASISCGCSTNSASVTRIVGGETAAAATWSWAVSLSIDDTYLCGGSIISSSWVLTAAHCVNGVTASKIIIYAGSNRVERSTQTRIASKVIVHSSYDTDTYVNDIALLQLASPLTMTDPYVSQICLPSISSSILSAGEWPPAGTTVVAVGWGTLREGGALPTYLQQVTLQTVPYNASTCAPDITDWHVQLCAGVSGGGKDTCQGDSGGPLMMFITSTKQWMLIGLTSNGIGCAEAAHSGIYTRVATFQAWINTNTNSAVTSVTVPPTTTISGSATQPTSTIISASTTRPTSTIISASTTRPTSTIISASTTRPTSTIISASTTRPISTTISASTTRSTSATLSPSTTRSTSTRSRTTVGSLTSATANNPSNSTQAIHSYATILEISSYIVFIFVFFNFLIISYL